MGAVNYTSDQFEFLIFILPELERVSVIVENGKIHAQDMNRKQTYSFMIYLLEEGHQISVAAIGSTWVLGDDPAYVSPSHEFNSLTRRPTKRIESID